MLNMEEALKLEHERDSMVNAANAVLENARSYYDCKSTSVSESNRKRMNMWEKKRGLGH
ncbi:unnamed protein product [Dovyalis caffra]|uniref:Uncharacterized protein n=1 Tax=Dovyalis caffra TaxID=77055 RepID=A0AAV1SJX7_9ROSI|nr:unnamed protein product [Dovyalis caffra]